MRKTILICAVLSVTVGILNANAQSNAVTPVTNTSVQTPLLQHVTTEKETLSNQASIEKLEKRLSALEQGRGKAFPESMYAVFKADIEAQIVHLRANKK